jgi:hypothetical protein
MLLALCSTRRRQEGFTAAAFAAITAAMITRRYLLASLAAVAGAMAVRKVPAAPVFTPRELHFMDGHNWAVTSLLEAKETGDYSDWTPFAPNRFQLAAYWAQIDEIPDPTELEATLRAEFRSLWFKLTRPGWRVIEGEAGFPV